MINTFKRIDELAEELRSLQPMKDEYRKRLDKKFRLEFNYNSNHIEGNTLTYGHTELLLIFDKVSGDYEAREIEEMKAHDVALDMVKELANDKERDLTENFIRQTNELILVRPFWKEALTPDGQSTRRLIEPGSYKKFPNSVRLANGEMFDYASPEETPAMMTELIDFYRSNKDKHPIYQAAMLHYKFVRIHPFDDGNGRVSRLLMNYIMYKHDLPPIIIKSNDKKGYITALNKADTGDIDAFISYIAEQAVWSLDISIRAARGENIDEKGDLDKEIDILKKNVEVNRIINKSPKIVYDTFIHVGKDCWTPLYQSLRTFNDFFNETKVEHDVNGYGQKYETKTKNAFLPSFITEESTEPKKVKIFGHDVYDTNIQYILWKEIKYGLRGVSIICNYAIILRLDFNIDNYSIQLQIDRINIYEVKKKYTNHIPESEVEEMIIAAKKHLTNSIQNNLVKKE